MKDMRDNNGGGEVYGFVTTGETWRMLRYDDISFKMTRKIEVLFEGMGQEKGLWMKDYSALVDCIFRWEDDLHWGPMSHPSVSSNVFAFFNLTGWATSRPRGLAPTQESLPALMYIVTHCQLPYQLQYRLQ
ncbi:uncharacterized protein LAJ45_08035 [Morchella importuna]|uniref:uncharacterized protein n=1 Tax=Morchella importuna TaxID=1174673 RepID=UPI001E8DCEDB|nr:uncharacterized protein LAJ45_08035 [Morchella importuna]KAH8147934.1 hypothetical protein LAJ45_08035 [Morchella importuna]